MPTVRIIIEIEAGEAGQTSIKVEQPETKTLDAVTLETKVHRLINEFGSNEKFVVKAALEALSKGRKVYRKEILEKLGFDQLLQFNGVLAWLTRKYDKIFGHGWLIETRYDVAKGDYSIEINQETPKEIIEAVKYKLGLQ